MNALRITCTTIALASFLTLFAQGDKQQFYILKTYTFSNEKQEQMTDAYLENAFLPALNRQGVAGVGVFKLREAYNVVANKTYVLIPYADLQEFGDQDEKLTRDQEYLTAGKIYLNATADNPPYQRISTMLMKAFSGMPKMKEPSLNSPRSERVYELRSYEGPTEDYYNRKVHMFNEGGEIALFESLGFNAVFYAEVLSGAKMPNLMYMTTFENTKSRDAHWKAFFASDKWTEIKDLPQYKNTVSHADIMLLYPTAYSDY